MFLNASFVFELCQQVLILMGVAKNEINGKENMEDLWKGLNICMDISLKKYSQPKYFELCVDFFLHLSVKMFVENVIKIKRGSEHFVHWYSQYITDILVTYWVMTAK